MHQNRIFSVLTLSGCALQIVFSVILIILVNWGSKTKQTHDANKQHISPTAILFYFQMIISTETKTETESKRKTTKPKKEPVSMFQINGDKPDFIAKMKGNFNILIIYRNLFFMYFDNTWEQVRQNNSFLKM